MAGRGSVHQMSDNHRRGAAFHEAGHAVVAWSLGLQVGDIAIGIDGDDAKGGAQIAADQHHLSVIDRVAICLAGLEAQAHFESPTHPYAGIRDFDRVRQIIGEDISEDESSALRNAGFERAREKIIENEVQYRRLADRLLEHGRVCAAEFMELMTA